MMRLFGSRSPMRSKLCGFFINIVQSYGYRLNCLVVALQILDRFLTNTTVSDVKECIYHYAFVSMMIAVEEVHGFPMTAKRFEHHVGERCSSRTIKRYKKEIMKTLMGVVSVATTTDLLMATLQVAAYKYPLEFAASDMFERIDRIRRNELPLEPRPFLFDFNLFVDPCSLAIAVACDQQCQKISGPKLASACFYVLVEEATDLDLDMLDGCALYSYKEVAAIASYIKKFVKSA
ncbi:hypothetical protein GGI05_003943 [Coemansia sp. RSA 2603]|nr:hypothetical protein GGI05_003943 [Coemansia sp. RSA 2603]